MNCTSCSRAVGSNPLECPVCLDTMNRVRLLVLPIPLGDTKLSDRIDHAQRLIFASMPKFVDEMNLDDHFVFMKQLEASAAAANLAYKQKLDKKNVSKEDIEARFKQSGSFAKAARQARIDNMPKKERKLMSAREVAIAQLVKIGLSEEEAGKQVDVQMSKQGRLVKVD